MNLDDAVKNFAKSDRQWRRDLRIAHYKHRMEHETGADRAFWLKLIALNEDKR